MLWLDFSGRVLQGPLGAIQAVEPASDPPTQGLSYRLRWNSSAHQAACLGRPRPPPAPPPGLQPATGRPSCPSQFEATPIPGMGQAAQSQAEERHLPWNVMEQFNPGLRNLINLGKNYEKAVNAMILAGKAYYDGVAKLGEIATGSLVSTELGRVLIEISSTHKTLNDSLEENFKKFHKEIIHELEKKTELDVKYMSATLKRYQTEHRSKLDSLEKSQAELKKIRRKSQGARNALKYEHKETEYVETVISRQTEIQKFIADGCKDALLEEKRRFCFLVDKHCSFAGHMHQYHLQSREALLSICCVVLSTRLTEDFPQVGKDYDTLSKYSPKMTPATSTKAYSGPLIDMFNNPATVAQNSERTNNSTEPPEDPSLQRSVSVATGLNLMKKQKVRAIFAHADGGNKTLLSFAKGAVITLLIPEEKDGWLYGELDATRVRGWFPSSYTQVLEGDAEEAAAPPVPSPVPVRSVSTVNLAEKSQVFFPPPDYQDCLSTGAAADKRGEAPTQTSTFRVTAPKPGAVSPNDANGMAKPPFLSGENPFATVKLRPTVTNDRSAPIIR
ncbi:brain-specific angiogenesis inhibitor 1-associated protein 2-like protein 1 [Echinops telfairi]|uniref:Brain-specific angiogenesis inhibitor 1-associated protein 2-like protein 1 n=1 Tax=Echinops telfairi TaxID=9371 RepID=A0AC55CLZ8_ECHTE|nr:brain-specific angiogenesis inhibitor 1-associated protein 2-like protein 1 [Echinops telfairi]